MTSLLKRGEWPGRTHEGFGLSSSPHPEFGTLFISCQPWWSPMALPATDRGVLMSHQGWVKGEWCDGIIARWEAGEVTDLILPGGPLDIELGPPGPPLADLKAWIAAERFFALKQSLAHGLKILALDPASSLNLEDGIELRPAHFDIEAVLNLLLARIAYPYHRFHFNAPHQGWRRLAQNLNITLMKADDQPRAFTPLPGSWGARETVRDLLAWQRDKSPFIPQHLWDEVSSW